MTLTQCKKWENWSWFHVCEWSWEQDILTWLQSLMDQSECSFLTQSITMEMHKNKQQNLQWCYKVYPLLTVITSVWSRIKVRNTDSHVLCKLHMIHLHLVT